MINAKLKRKIIAARNKRKQMILQHERLHESEHARIIEEEEEKREKAREAARSEESRGDNEVWSAKTQEIKDKLRRKKRKSKDRWNRFSGTSDGGSRGR